MSRQVGFRPLTYEHKKIAELAEGQRVEIKGIVIAVSERKYDGCVVCRRKKCDTHNEGTREWTVSSFLLADASGKVWCSKFSDKSEPLEIADELVVKGMVGTYRDKLQIIVHSLESQEPYKVKHVRVLMEAAGELEEDTYVALLAKNEVKVEEMEKYVEEFEPGRWRLKKA